MTTEARLLSVLRDNLLSPESVLEMQRQVKEIVDDRRREAESKMQRNAQRIHELDQKIARLVEAIAACGVSPVLQTRLKAAEAERERLCAPAQDGTAVPVERTIRNVISRYQRQVMDLASALGKDPERARAILRDIFGEIRVFPDGDEVFAEIETRPDRLLLAAGGVSLGTVAGARFRTRRRIKIR